MFDFIKRKLQKLKLKRTFKEYGYELKTFEVDGIGTVEYAQWLHPFEQQKSITNSNINFYRKLARPGAMIIDIGAHTGDTSVPMALAVGKQGLVVALEPNKFVYKILEKNAALNRDYTNIKALCFAATKEDGDFVFNYSDASFNNGGFLSEIHVKNHHHDYTLNVQGKNVERYLLTHFRDQLEKLDLLKIDAEGYDKEILKTIPEILKQYKPNLMVECYKRLDENERHELYDIIHDHGYNLYYLENFEETGNKILVEKKNMTDRKHFEMLAIHQDRL
ncbi:FkbM family methyltransferase [Chryseolinea sp. H1M3-3]|uniref:FkbM family methyltransferase n=1 Tax=Chryseolinea sp. H1M3-3 TaxID=3034144 RepID=UPI0023EC5D0B|nr:FkbM family methyltransferase [Chryseolinea sp. H1M3-3]